MFTLFGLKTCDSCRKARRALSDAGHEVTFVDLRETPVDPADLARWYAVLGPNLMNTKSTTWRGLDAAERTRAPLDLMRDHPSLIKRPVIDRDGALFLGWGKDVQATLL